MSKFDKNQIVQLLEERGAVNPCSRCGNPKFTILEGFSHLSLQENHNDGVVLGGKSVPIVHVACTNCGNLSMHAIGVLGLLENR